MIKNYAEILEDNRRGDIVCGPYSEAYIIQRILKYNESFNDIRSYIVDTTGGFKDFSFDYGRIINNHIMKDLDLLELKNILMAYPDAEITTIDLSDSEDKALAVKNIITSIFNKTVDDAYNEKQIYSLLYVNNFDRFINNDSEFSAMYKRILKLSRHCCVYPTGICNDTNSIHITDVNAEIVNYSKILVPKREKFPGGIKYIA